MGKKYSQEQMEHKNNQILSFQNFVTEKYELNESFEVIFSDGISQKKDFKSKSKAINFMRDKISTNKKLKYIAVYKGGSGFYSTSQTDRVISFWGDGSYLDNLSKKDKDLASKKMNEGKLDESLNERKYSEEERKDLASKGLALDDGSFPIKDLADLKNAIQAYGRAKDQAKAAKFISKRAKALGAEDLIPDTEDFQKSLKESLDGSEVFQILDAAAMFTDDAHVAANQMWKDRKDLIDYLLSDHIPKKYHKQFLKYVKEDESTVLEGKLTYSNVNMYGSEIKTIEDLVSILNTFDNYAEMSDDSKKGDKMYSAVRMIKQFADKNKIKLSKLQNKLNDKGQTALKRYF